LLIIGSAFTFYVNTQINITEIKTKIGSLETTMNDNNQRLNSQESSLKSIERQIGEIVGQLKVYAQVVESYLSKKK